MGIWMGVLMGILMGILMVVSMGWPYDSSDCLLVWMVVLFIFWCACDSFFFKITSVVQTVTISSNLLNSF